jgi:ketosteroid isomerase-like protein
MSQENVEAIRPVYDQWERGNFRPQYDIYGPDMELLWSEEFPDLHGVFRDPEVRSHRLREWLSPWQEWQVEAEDYVSAGDFVVVLCRYTGRGKESGVEVDARGAHLWTMREGKAVRLEIFSSRRKALEAAGLSKQDAHADS